MRVLKSDVAILGSGFAGSLMALVLQREGLRPVVVDRAAHPRFAIGESSTPVADMILRDLSDRYDLPRIRPLSRYGSWKATYPEIGVGRKRGFSYFYHEADLSFRPRSDHANELLVAASSEDAMSDTHWFRADVDAFLADEVRRAGIPLLENTEVTSIEPGQPVTVLSAGATIRADFVIDASGAGGAISKAFGIADTADRLETYSRTVFTHLVNVPLWQDVYGADTSDHPYDCDAAALHHVVDGGWIWMLRFDHGVVSAGLMVDRRRPPDWEAVLQQYPSLREQFAGARPAEIPGRWIGSPDRIQRRAAQVVGDDWAMLPHTAGFIDPLHSTGIAHSLSGVERLAEILAAHWSQPSLADALTKYEAAVHQELDFIDTLVAACYASMHNFGLFTASTMMYFAVVTEYERLRLSGEHAGKMFLCPDMLPDVARKALAMLRSGVKEAEYWAFVEEAIEPFNRVGLFHPAVPNMYHHTAAKI